MLFYRFIFVSNDITVWFIRRTGAFQLAYIFNQWNYKSPLSFIFKPRFNPKMKLESINILKEGFRLFTHAFTTEMDHEKLIGLDKAGNIILRSPENVPSEEPTKLINTHGMGGQIVNIISQGFDKSDFPVLVTVKKNSKSVTELDNYFCNFSTKAKLSKDELIFESNSTPMLITHPKTLRPVIIFTRQGKLIFGEINESGKYVEMKESYSPSSLPSGVHTSSYLDVTGDMNANLILHTKIGDKNGILILEPIFGTTETDPILSFNELQSIALPDNIGPIQFAELSNETNPDMIFISKEGTEYYLNVYKNSNSKKIPENLLKNLQDLKKFFITSIVSIPYNSTDIIHFPLKSIIAADEEINLVDNDTPRGMFLADLTGKGFHDIFIVVDKINKTNSTIKMIEFNRNSGEFSFNSEFSSSNLMDNLGYISGVTVLDTNDKGIEYLVVNAKNSTDEFPALKAIQHDHKIEITAINLLPLNMSADGLINFIAGACFVQVFENEEAIIKTSMLFQTSYSSMQRHKTFVGLKQTNLFINHFALRVPSSDNKKNTYDALTFLVPNTFAIFTFKQNKWEIQSLFTNRYYKQTLVSLLAILVVFIFILFYLSFQDKKKYKMVTNRDSMRRVFNAL